MLAAGPTAQEDSRSLCPSPRHAKAGAPTARCPRAARSAPGGRACSGAGARFAPLLCSPSSCIGGEEQALQPRKRETRPRLPSALRGARSCVCARGLPRVQLCFQSGRKRAWQLAPPQSGRTEAQPVAMWLTGSTAEGCPVPGFAESPGQSCSCHRGAARGGAPASTLLRPQPACPATQERQALPAKGGHPTCRGGWGGGEGAAAAVGQSSLGCTNCKRARIVLVLERKVACVPTRAGCVQVCTQSVCVSLCTRHVRVSLCAQCVRGSLFT